MDLELGGKVALVTGVSQGIGLAVADVLLGEGMQVFGTSRTPPPERTAIAHLALDMSESDAGERAVAACIERFGRLDVLVNNVGSARIATGFDSESDASWQAFWELNVMSMIRTSRSALPHLVAERGVIVNISSVNGDLPEPGIYSYSAGKAAMNNITVNLSKEYGRQRVRVVSIAPGPVSTPLWLGPGGVAETASAMGAGTPEDVVKSTEANIPIGRFSTPEEIGYAVAFLASPKAGSITGTTLRVDGGMTPTL